MEIELLIREFNNEMTNLYLNHISIYCEYYKKYDINHEVFEKDMNRFINQLMEFLDSIK